MTFSKSADPAKLSWQHFVSILLMLAVIVSLFLEGGNAGGKVSIEGNVKFPGSFIWSPGLRARELVIKAGGFLDDSNLRRACIFRHTHLQGLDFQRGGNPEIWPGDRVVIPKFGPRPYQYAVGDQFVMNIIDTRKEGPGNQHYEQSVDWKGNISPPHLLVPFHIAGMDYNEAQYALEAVYNSKKGDRIFIRLNPDEKQGWLGLPAEVTVGGEVNSPGDFEWQPGMTLNQVLRMSGGLSETGSYREVRLIRDRKVIEFNLRRDQSAGEIELEMDDQIVARGP